MSGTCSGDLRILPMQTFGSHQLTQGEAETIVLIDVCGHSTLLYSHNVCDRMC